MRVWKETADALWVSSEERMSEFRLRQNVICSCRRSLRGMAVSAGEFSGRDTHSGQ